MKARRIYVLIGGLLLVIALSAAGFFLYGFFTEKENLTDTGENSTPVQLPYEYPQYPGDPPITPFRALNAKILLLPQATASADEKKEYIAFVSKYASKQNSVTIKDCHPDPIVIWVKQGSQIEIKNEDDAEHTISMNKKLISTVPSKGSAKIKADFGRGPGVYAYECGDSEGPVGIFLISSN